jgi:transcriptional regulator with XRE-family HTH domain
MPSDKRGYFAKQLQHLREKAGLSQYALARRAELSKQAISNIEAGNRPDPTWETVQRLALALGVACSELADPDLELSGAELRTRGRPKVKK